MAGRQIEDPLPPRDVTRKENAMFQLVLSGKSQPETMFFFFYETAVHL